MADKFYDGMPNVNDKLNELDRAFAAGPYNALPLTGGTLSGMVRSSSYFAAAAYGSTVVLNTGNSAGWWRVARIEPGSISLETTIRIAGATDYAASPPAGKALETFIVLRVENDGAVRGHFYSVGGSTANVISAVRVGTDGSVYVYTNTYFTLAVYINGSTWRQQELEFLGTTTPTNTNEILPIFGLKLGAQATMTVTPTAITFDPAMHLAGPRQIFAGALTSGSNSTLRAPNDGQPGVAGVSYEVQAMGVAQIPGVSNSGRFFWSTRGGGGNYGAGYSALLSVVDANAPASPVGVLEVSGTGALAVPGFLTAGPATSRAAKHQASANTVESGEIFHVGRYGKINPCFGVNGSSGDGGWGGSNSVVYIGRNSLTGRSLSLGGTVNASGADYAEYMRKAASCGTILAGQVIGIDAGGKLTDKWADAISFCVKSTNPCLVGGDSWAQQLGDRPAPVERIQPGSYPILVNDAVDAVPAQFAEIDGKLVEVVPSVAARAADYRDEIVPGDTDEEWAAKQAPGLVFDAALEAARQMVDRIAFSGQVPVNVFGSTAGQYIVPVQAGDGIAGVAIDEDDLTLKQYLRAIGKVIAIEDDGRARIIVKVA